MNGRHSGLRAAVAAAALGALLAGCTPLAVTGTAESAPAGPLTTKLGIGPPPPVDQPLDASKVIAAPCTSLAASILAAPNLPLEYYITPDGPGTPTTTPNGPSCEWREAAKGRALTITWLTHHPEGLGYFYAHWSSYDVWIPLTSDGYPGYPAVLAAMANQGADLYLAVNDRDVCEIHYHDDFQRPSAPPDAELTQVADVVLASIRKG